MARASKKTIYDDSMIRRIGAVAINKSRAGAVRRELRLGYGMG